MTVKCLNDLTDDPIYDWTCPYCRARFLNKLPNRDARAGWVDRWKLKRLKDIDETINILKTFRK